jgi:hypothetical protein
MGLETYVVSSAEPIPAGTHQLRMEFAYDGGGLGSPIGADMPLAESTFNGSVMLVEIDLGPAESDHLVSREDVLAILMAHQ